MSPRIEARDGGLVMQVNTRADLYDAIRVNAEMGAVWRVPLLQALLHGRIAFFEAARSTSTTTVKRFQAAAQKPAVILLGDDDAAPTGPAGWPVAERVMRWARFIVVHAAGGTVEQYAEIVDAAVMMRRVVVIETSTAQAPAWAKLAKAIPGRPSLLMIKPRGELPHPVAPQVRQ